MGKSHVVVVTGPEGVAEAHALKSWIRQHPDELPFGVDPEDSTSHQLRAGLRKRGWTMDETADQVRLIKPGAESIPESTEASSDVGVIEEAPETSFALEYQLRDFLASNLGKVSFDGKQLRLFAEGGKQTGVEYPSGVGPIDILAVDTNGDFYVLELKRGSSPDKTAGQLARYMGWVQKNLAAGKGVFGIIVAQSVSTNLRYAASMMPNVRLFEYKIEFQLAPAHDIP